MFMYNVSEEISKQLIDCKAKYVFTISSFLPTIQEAIKMSGHSIKVCKQLYIYNSYNNVHITILHSNQVVFILYIIILLGRDHVLSLTYSLVI